MSRHIMAIFASICFAVMLLAAGLGVCLIPATTEMIASRTDTSSDAGIFSAEELTQVALATLNYTMFGHDKDAEMDCIQAINKSAGTPYANASIEELLEAPEQYTLDKRAFSHLDDCYNVINGARAVVIAIAIAGIVLFVVLCCKGAEGRRSLSRALKASAVIGILAFIGFAAFALYDFNAFFAWFHSLFFEPGTWLFSATSLLISMYPQDFWLGMAIIWFVASVLVSFLLFALGSAIKPRKVVS